jgi:hypothetical protein
MRPVRWVAARRLLFVSLNRELPGSQTFRKVTTGNQLLLGPEQTVRPSQSLGGGRSEQQSGLQLSQPQ